MPARRPSFMLRLAVCLLAALHCVAVSWHVCELGGNPGAAHCHPAPAVAGAQQCHANDDPTRAWRMAMDQAAPAEDTHCLAALLSTTPAQTAQTFVLAAVFVPRALPPLEAHADIARLAMFGVDARGPPILS